MQKKINDGNKNSTSDSIIFAMCGLKRNSQHRKKLDNKRHETIFEAMTQENERHPVGKLKNQTLIASAGLVK